MAYLLGAAVAGRSVITVVEGQVVRAYATGTALHLDALQQGGLPDGTRLADVEVAFSSANVDSNGFGAVSEINENEVFLQPNPADHDPATPFVGKNASGRGGPIEIGLINGVPVEPTIPLTLLARSGATAPPDTQESNEAGLEDALSPIAYASLLRSDAIAQWQNSTCLTTAQSPISYGRGYAADVQLLDTEQNPDGGPFESALVATDDDDPARNAVQTSSFVYAIGPNANGKYGLVSEIHQTYAPVQVGRTLIIEVLGEWFVKTTVNGVSPATIEYGVTDSDPASPTYGDPLPPGATVIRVSTDGGVTYDGFSLQDLGAEGIVIDAAPLPIQIALGEDLRAISAPGAIPNPDSSPTLTPTAASGAVDVVRIDVLDDPVAFGSLADLRIGHFETEMQVPNGGFACPAPPTTTSTTTTSTTTTTVPPTTTTSTTTTTVPPTTTSTTSPPPPPTTAPTTTTSPPPPAPRALPIRVQPRTVG